IKVEVPTLFAFVVKGAVTTDATPVGSGADGNIYLPNVKVDVTTPSSGGQGAVFELQTEGNLVEAGKLPFTNYSTYDDGGTRKGLEVKINGNIKNEGTPESRKYWTHTTSANTGAAATNFKNYNVSIDSNEFNTAANGGLQMAAGITLDAPDADLGGASGSAANVGSDDYAVVGETHYAAFDVSVGGQKDQYSQVEESAKIGTIVWTISATIEDDVDTAPNEDYLQP
ncbi:hypothetical protein, partial [Lacrimispora sp.]|uniref:hypothetical protein n=1 Tax=Lacrimispora sp. TaxID=2719234 RepID=UPI0028A77C77